ncbi:hypothetical protein WJU23_09795 [Prosthecobacter sp. SYSU 5D2]|uniref:hypothetical protein n=1 Tax=Prosthecobacter sp. SYSU 5D2 TaxID=3134134 RepID=UPI0031FE993F
MKKTLASILLILLAAPMSRAADQLPDSLLTVKSPSGALSVVKARQTAKAGEAIVVRGRIGGRAMSLMDKAAIAVLADEKSIVPCDANPADSCKTPWDYCCESPEKLKAGTATIQVKGENGKLLRTSLRGFSGLKELSTVVVAGTVDASSTQDALIINVASIHVEKQ